MKKFQLTVLLFTGIIPLVLPVSRKYLLIQQARNWTDAQAYCRTNFDDLASFESNDDFMKLESLLQTQKFINTWIGMYTDSSGWHWSLGNQSLGQAQWYPTRPINGNYECTILTYYMGWWDTLCTETHPFTCFDDRYTGNGRYILINSPMSWYDAQSYCRQNHTDLASARDSTENFIILQLIAGSPLISWIGLFRAPWKWSDQTNMPTIPWITGRPGIGQCGYLYNDQAADAGCSNLMPFICYKIVYTREQQIMKVKVQSNQNVNDPFIMDSILEKIKQMIQEYRMSDNTTVNWRERTDGVVFHKEKQTLT